MVCLISSQIVFPSFLEEGGGPVGVFAPAGSQKNMVQKRASSGFLFLPAFALPFFLCVFSCFFMSFFISLNFFSVFCFIDEFLSFSNHFSLILQFRLCFSIFVCAAAKRENLWSQ